MKNKKNKIYKTSVAARYNPDCNIGLISEQVELRKKEGYVNKQSDPSNKSYFRIIISNIVTFFNIVIAAIAALLILFEPFSTTIKNLGFLIIIIFNILIGIIQECRSKHTIEKLKLINVGKIMVIRNGYKLVISPEEIVLDDMLVLKSGDQIPVDCIIRNGIVESNEALLTGESDAIKKNVGDMLYAGAFIASGTCYAVADKIGNDTYAHSIESKASIFKEPKSQLMTGLNSIIRKLTTIFIPLGLLMFWQIFIKNGSSDLTEVNIFGMIIDRNLSVSILKGCTIIVGMMPVGMILLSSIAMATGVMNLARKNTLAQNLYSVESLARIDCLCLDKTGTITDGTMTVDNGIYYDKDVENIIQTYLSAFDDENQTSIALANYYGKSKIYDVTDKIPFSSKRKFSAVKMNDKWYVLGAPEFIMNDKTILNIVKEQTSKGMRVVVLASCQSVNEDGKIIGNPVACAIFVLRDNIRKEVKRTMQWFTENDVTLRVISGDNIETVSFIAKIAGIPNYEKAVDLSTVSKSDFEQVVLDNYVFGRVTPEQKAEIVDILHEHGHTVAITGDGVNDVLAMKKSECSIAMANGSPATKNIANVVLLDSNFDNMPKVVMEGRRVINNIQRSSILYLMKVFFVMFSAILAIVLGIDFPFEISAMRLINIILTGLCAFAISVEPCSTRIQGNFVKYVLSKSIAAGFFMFLPLFILITVTMINAFIANGGVSQAAISQINNLFISGSDSGMSNVGIIALMTIITGNIVFAKLCRPFTKYRTVLFVISLVITIGAIVLLPRLFLTDSEELKTGLETYRSAGYDSFDSWLQYAIGLFRWKTVEINGVEFMGNAEYFKLLFIPNGSYAPLYYMGGTLIIGVPAYLFVDHIINKILDNSKLGKIVYDEKE